MLGAHFIYVTLSKHPTTWTCFWFLSAVLLDPCHHLTRYPISQCYNAIIHVLLLGVTIIFQLRHHRETTCHSWPSVMTTWQTRVGDGPHLTVAHPASQDMCQVTLYSKTKNTNSCPHHPNCTPGPSCTFARSDSAWLCAVRTKARVGPGTVCLPALCSCEPLRRAGNSSFQPRPSEKCDSHQWWENGPNKCTHWWEPERDRPVSFFVSVTHLLCLAWSRVCIFSLLLGHMFAFSLSCRSDQQTRGSG